MTERDFGYVADWCPEAGHSWLRPRFTLRIVADGTAPVALCGTVLVDDHIEVIDASTPLEREYRADHVALVVRACDTGEAIRAELWSDRHGEFCRVASFAGACGGYILDDRTGTAS